MGVPILTTKLYVPPPRAQAVVRPRLIKRLNEGLREGGDFATKLTLISAPAGFGKTTLISAWCKQEQLQVAWLSLDEGDSDPTRFLTYLVAALQTVPLSNVEGLAPNFGQGVLDALETTPPPPTEAILSALLNEISTVTRAPSNTSGRGFVLVLDDYHLVDSGAVDDALTFLLDHMPPQMHLVITTREDPRLPLPRLRVRGQLTELRAADLRFTPSEAAEFLNAVMGLNLPADEITALENRTEGWIAGLQLASLAIRGNLALQEQHGTQAQQDVPGFVRTFAGDHRYIVDYLVAEVLEHQTKPVRNFLLQTSILNRLNGSLCDALTGQEASAARLDALERGNFFVVPLDDSRRWYRYHHLFAQVLYAHLLAEQSNQIATLHLRASEWFERNGLARDAIHHALAANDFERAADLIELLVPELRRNRQEGTLLELLQALPDELFHYRPVLAIYYAGALLLGGEIEGVEKQLHNAERWVGTPQDASARTKALKTRGRLDRKMVVRDQAEFRRMPSWVCIYRAALALAMGDVPNTVKFAGRGLELVSEDDNLARGAAAGFFALASWTGGDLGAAYRSYAECSAILEEEGHIPDVMGCAIALADIRLAQGRLRDAMSPYERGLQLATEQGAPRLRGTADMHVGMSEIYLERNDLDAANQQLVKSKELGELAGLRQYPYRWCVAMARIRQVNDDFGGAVALLNEAERVYVSDYLPNVRPIAALRTRVWIAEGELEQALGWVRERGLAVTDELDYLHEFEHITLAKVLFEQYRRKGTEQSLLELIEFLQRLLKAAEQGGRKESVIEISMLQALVQQMQGAGDAALARLERALTLAEPEGYVRIFVDAGPAMEQLLVQAAARGIMPEYTAKLLGAFRGEQQKSTAATLVPTPPGSQPPVEPLTGREIEILRLFKTELSGPEIADKLVIALSTLRTHTKNIFSKLDVTNRRAAVQRAIELNLI